MMFFDGIVGTRVRNGDKRSHCARTREKTPLAVMSRARASELFVVLHTRFSRNRWKESPPPPWADYATRGVAVLE